MKPAFHGVLATLALCAAALAARVGSPTSPLAPDEISAVELAEWIRARRTDLVVLDTRTAQALEADGLPGARLAADFEAGTANTLVLYGDQPLTAAPLLRGTPRRLLKLHGGIAAWNRDVLFPVIRSDASQRQQTQFASRAQLSRYFGGSPRVLDPGTQSHRNRSRRGC
ncbi:MAG: hypothetical protein ACT4NL_09010 [Pseudomarimonas sp.]